jgi:hypothetical protein
VVLEQTKAHEDFGAFCIDDAHLEEHYLSFYNKVFLEDSKI